MGSKTYESIEPERYEERLAAIIAENRRFPQGWLHDGDALAPAAFAGLPLVGIVGCVYAGLRGKFETPLFVIIAACAVLAAALVGLSYVLYRRHAAVPVYGDLFVTGGVLYKLSWIEDRKKYGSSGKGIVRINAVPLAVCRGYRNKKDGMVWIIPRRQDALRDIWRYGHRWEERRRLCEKLAESGIEGKGDADPFMGVYDEFLDFLVELGIPIEETDRPVDFLAGTASGIFAGGEG